MHALKNSIGSGFVLYCLLALMPGCKKADCVNPNNWPSSYDNVPMVVGISVDSTNGGFTMGELDNIFILHSVTDTIGKTPPYGFSPGYFYYKIGFNIYTNSPDVIIRDANTQSNYTIRDIKYEVVENDCDDKSYSVTGYSINGLPVNGTDTLFIQK